MGNRCTSRLTRCKETPKNPIILAHGLFGFDEIHLPPKHLLPGIHYWRGIREALTAKGIDVFTTTVPASATIEQRAVRLGEDIAAKAGGRSVNIIAYVPSFEPYFLDELTGF